MNERFQAQMEAITAAVAGKPLNDELQAWLNEQYGPDSEWFRATETLCRQGVAEGWLCQHEAGGLRYGRVIKPGPATAGFSVDVVDMEDIRGPHHSHPNGEIDLVMPQSGDARFDLTPAGWKVYPPGTAHYPTVRDGRALVLYLLPEGSIQFTKT
ncbi:MAG: DUF4863 family protein [Pigmentiphaga sp.]